MTDSTRLDMLRRAVWFSDYDNNLSGIQLLDQHLESNPNDLLARAERAKAMLRLKYDKLGIALGFPEKIREDISFVISYGQYISAEDYDAYGLALAIQGYTGPIENAKDTWKSAERAFEQSIRLDSQRPDVYRHRAQMFMWMDNNRSALADIERAVALAPNDVVLLSKRSFLRKDTGDNQGAWADANEIIRLDPDHVEGYSRRSSLRDDNDDQGRLEDLNQILRIDSYRIEDLRSRALLYLVMENQSLALQDYERIILLNADDENALSMAAFNHQQLGNHPKAIEYFSTVIRLKPDDASNYGLRAKSYCALGDTVSAQEDEQRYDELKKQEQVQSLRSSQTVSEQVDLFGFVRHYWSSFAWIGLAVIGILGIIGFISHLRNVQLIVDAGGTRPQFPREVTFLLCIGIVASMYRFFKGGGNFSRVIEMEGASGFFLNLLAWFAKFVFVLLVWIIAEPIQQVRFLRVAWLDWKDGLVH